MGYGVLFCVVILYLVQCSLHQEASATALPVGFRIPYNSRCLSQTNNPNQCISSNCNTKCSDTCNDFLGVKLRTSPISITVPTGSGGKRINLILPKPSIVKNVIKLIVTLKPENSTNGKSNVSSSVNATASINKKGLENVTFDSSAYDSKSRLDVKVFLTSGGSVVPSDTTMIIITNVTDDNGTTSYSNGSAIIQQKPASDDSSQTVPNQNDSQKPGSDNSVPDSGSPTDKGSENPPSSTDSSTNKPTPPSNDPSMSQPPPSTGDKSDGSKPASAQTSGTSVAAADKEGAASGSTTSGDAKSGSP